MQLSSYTIALLEDIERRINPEAEEDFQRQWKDFWYTSMDVPVCRPCRKNPVAPGMAIRNIKINDALEDFELMLDSQLASLSYAVGSGGGALGMRANYGSGIMTSLFGTEIFIMPYETDTLPTTKSINDRDRMRELVEKGVPDLNGGFGKKVFDFGERCAEIFEHYPKIKAYTDVFHPDTQGPLDIADLLWGSEIFCEMYEDPDLVHSVMRLVTDTYKAFMDKWYTYFPIREGITWHWGIMQRGTVMLRLDSAMNISDEFYNEYSKPYDREVMDYYGGGVVHFCGRGDHYIQSLCDIDTVYGINLSQPHLNDMELILKTVSEKDKRIVGLWNADHYAELPVTKRGVLHG